MKILQTRQLVTKKIFIFIISFVSLLIVEGRIFGLYKYIIYDLIYITFILWNIMPITEDQISHLKDQHSHQQSFFYSEREQNLDIPPSQLSGEEQGQQSIFASSAEAVKSNFLLTVTLIMKTVIGSAILGIPYTVSKCGFLFAIIVFLFALAATQFSVNLLLKAKNLSGHSNYSTILYHIINSKFAKALGSFLIFFDTIGTCIAEIIIFKRTIRQNIFESLLKGNSILDSFWLSEYMIAIFIALIQTPFTLTKKMEKLKFMALLGVVGILVFIIAFVTYYIVTVAEDDVQIREMNLFPDNWFSAAAAIPNILLALSFQMNFFPIYKGMKDTNDHKMKLASLTGIGICAISYLIVGILGYSLVGSDVQGNFLLSIDYESSNKILYFIINIGFLISIFCAFPIMFFSCRNNFIALINLVTMKPVTKKQSNWRQDHNKMEQISSYIENQGKTTEKKKTGALFLLYTFLIYLIIIGIGILVADVESVFNILGAICSTSIGMLLPAYFYFMLIIKKKKPIKPIFYWSIIMFVIMAPFGIFSIVAQYVHI